MKTDVQISTEAAKPVGGERKLERFFEPSNGKKRQDKDMLSLHDADDKVPFDQFQGKKTSYRDEIYTTTIDQSKITEQIVRFAEQKEWEILN